jgi:DNA-directed RNA polymerase specialized sigma24 family protein
MHQEPAKDDAASSPQWFRTTHWSLVSLISDGDSPQATAALEKLCGTYWLPVYSYIRRQGYSPHDAQDLAQGFFARLLRLNSFAAVGQSKGKFRTFLLAALNHFLSDERDRARAEKRGGGKALISLDEAHAEELYLQIPAPDLTPEKLYDRHWALTVMEQALGRLRKEYGAAGNAAVFEHLSGFLSREATPGDYDRAAQKLGMTRGAMAVAVHRLRQRYRECVRFELSQTVTSPEDLELEMKHLFQALTG